MSKINVNCDFCGNAFLKRKDAVERTKNNFCSKECTDKFRSKKVDYNCDYCGNLFQITNSKHQSLLNNQIKHIYCSKQCKQKWESENWIRENNPRGFSRIIKTCEYCNKEYEIGNHRKDISRFCSVKCKNLWQKYVLSKDEEWLKFRRSVGIKSMKSQKNKFTKPERIVKEHLEDNNIEYIPQHPLFDRFVVDFYLPKLNLVIEVLGDYWHGHPDKYGDGENLKPLTEKQIHNKERDIFKFNFIKDKKLNIIMVWESDIYKDVNNSLKLVM